VSETGNYGCFGFILIRSLHTPMRPATPYTTWANGSNGDVLTTTWLSRSEYRSARQSYPSLLGGYGYHAAFTYRLPALIRLFAEPWFYLTRGLFLSCRLGRYDAIIVYGPFKTAIIALLLKWITGSPLIVEVSGNPFRSFAFDPTWMGRLKQIVSTESSAPQH